MAGITLEESEEILALWILAEKQIANGGQSYAIAGRSLTRIDASEITNKIEYWNEQVKLLSSEPAEPVGQQGVIVSQFDYIHER